MLGSMAASRSGFDSGKRRPPDMNVLDSLRLMVREYPGGIAAVALRLGKSPSTLEKELRADAGYKFGVLDACAVTEMCHEMRVPSASAYVTAAAASCCATVAIEPPPAAPSDRELVAQTGKLLREVGDVVSAVIQAGGDGRVSLNELRAVEKEGREALLALQCLVAAIERLHEEGRPSHVRAGGR
jgi:hypothetical protein